MKLVECCHIYWSDFVADKLNLNFRDEIALLNKAKLKDDVKTVVLIDDHHLDETMASREYVVSQIKDYLASENISINEFFFESDCADYVDIVLNKIPEECLIKESFDRGTRKCVFLKGNDKKIPLFKEDKDGNKIYTCPLLSAVWVLIKNDIIRSPLSDQS